MSKAFSTFGAPMLCAIALLGAPLQATAEITQQTGIVADVDGEVRVNIAGKLRMLSQRIPAAACNYHAGISPDVSATALEAAQAEFVGILNALEHGDPEFGVLSAEERFRTIRTIEEVHTQFEPIKAALASSSRSAMTDATLQVLADQNMEVLEIAKVLVSEISGQYANPAALLQSDAMTIDIAGRQRMLTQKISKEVCQAMSGVNEESSRAALANTVNVFEVSLDALQNGRADVGIQTPPNGEIIAGLQQVQSDWLAVRSHVQTVRDGGRIDDEARAALFVGLNTTLKNMNAVVGMYAKAADLGL